MALLCAGSTQSPSRLFPSAGQVGDECSRVSVYFNVAAAKAIYLCECSMATSEHNQPLIATTQNTEAPAQDVAHALDISCPHT